MLLARFDFGRKTGSEVIAEGVEAVEDGDVLAEWLSEKRGKRVDLVVPHRGPRMDLVGIARQNAEGLFRAERAARMDEEAAMALLRDKLHLHRLPRRVECVDISNIGGEMPVGSLVTFSDGKPDKSGYRLFHVRGVEGPDDYAGMHEVLRRRFDGRENLPDLIMLDGGKGQLGIALSVLRELGVEGPDVIGLAKELPVSEMEKLILANTKVGDEDVRLLGAQRAQAVKSWLLDKGQVPAERVFLLSTHEGDDGKQPKARVSRVDFSLR